MKKGVTEICPLDSHLQKIGGGEQKQTALLKSCIQKVYQLEVRGEKVSKRCTV